MKKNKLFTREFLIGAIGITALVVLYFLINFFKGIDLFKMGNTYYVKFDNISQLASSSPIYLNGFKAGNVREIHYDYSNLSNIVVEIEIDKRLQIPSGSTAKITTHILGGADISIDLTDSSTPIAPGDTIKGYLDKGLMGEASEKMLPAINSIVPKVDSVLTALNVLLQNPALASSVDNIESLTAELGTTTRQLNSLLSNDIPQITGRMVQLEDNLIATTSELKEVDYARLFGSLDSTLTNLQHITTALREGEGTAGRLLSDTALYHNLNRTTEAATALLENLRENPKRYVHFSLFGRKEK